MTVTDKPAAYDTNADLARLLDAGYEVTFQRWAEGPGGEYFANIASEMGSRWKGLGSTPGEALRSVWPLGYERGQGGCGHCGGLGCETAGCKVCAAYTDDPGNGVCGVCGTGEPDHDPDDDLEPYCSACGAAIGIFYGHGDGWHHYRGDGTAASPVELYDADHAPVAGWRLAGVR